MITGKMPVYARFIV